MQDDVASKKILIVEDDPGTRNLIHKFLKQSKQNYQIESVTDGTTALAVFEQFQPDLVILSVTLPDITGIELCQQMKSRRDIKVMLLTSLHTKSLYAGFELADAHLTKPFYIQVLENQVEALLRQAETSTHAAKSQTSTHAAKSQTLVLENIVIDPESWEVTLNDQVINLTPLEFDILYFLATHPCRVWRRKELMREVLGYEHREIDGAEDRVVDIHIAQIRKKIEQDFRQPKYIKTVHGVGYKFEIPEVSDER
ncbi:response regulator transcription factor [Floridanema evergladense]|uniref:Response regulator transcription factor n=1 Tax=Floridaenema evergladense BLCC-F167 TaxID=3153639 RepID=A0ABV4WMW6_9CYAN